MGTTQTQQTKIATEKTDAVLMKATLKTIGMTPQGIANLDAAGMASAIEEHYRKLPRDRQIECDRCGGVSDINLDACPLCGFTDEGVEAEEVATPPTEDKKAVNGAAAAAPSAEKETPVGDEKKKKGKKAAANGASTAMVKAEAAPLAGVTVKALDAAVAEVMTLKSATTRTLWQLGRKLAEIHEKQLWKARQIVEGEKKTDAYKSWNQFCLAELHLTPTSAYSYIDIAKTYDEKTTAEHGKEKLAIIVRAPKEMQAELLEAAKTHGKRELQRRVTEAKKASGNKKRDTGRKAMPAGVPGAKGIKVSQDRITVASVLRTYTFKMFKHPGDAKTEPSVPAKKLSDRPTGFIDLDNKVRIWIVVGEKDGVIVGKAILKRKGE